jgi:RimJ/RimL family protein N-acetyltransferase
MTDSFPKYTVTTAETGLTEGDSEYAGGVQYIWRQPDKNDDGGYWEANELQGQPALAEAFALIIERLTVIEAALNITPAEP